MVASTTPITAASVAPIRVIPLARDGSDPDGATLPIDPRSTGLMTEVALLRAIFDQLITLNSNINDLASEARKQTDLLVIMSGMDSAGDYPR